MLSPLGDSADNHADLAEVVKREQQLLGPSVRASSEQVARLLHPDFVEFGASGRVWDRDSVAAALAADPDVSGRGSNFSAVRLADDVILLTYRMEAGSSTLRSSLWVRDSELGWCLRFHQGTPTPLMSSGES